MQNERDLMLKVLSTVKVGEVLVQLVQEIKEMKAQLQCVSADIALQSRVLGQIRTDRGCRHQQNNPLLCRVCTANYRKLQKGTQ